MKTTKNTSFRPATLPQALFELYQNLEQHQTSEAAWAIVKEYFFFFGSGAGVRDDMWQLLSGTLTNKEIPNLKKAVDRHNLIFFYEFTLMFIDAVNHLLALQKDQTASVGQVKDQQPPG